MCNPCHNPEQAEETWCMLVKLQSKNTKIQLIKSHIGTTGNEMPGMFTKLALSWSSKRNLRLPRSQIKRLLNIEIIKQRQTKWDKASTKYWFTY